MTECNAIIKANNEIDKLKRENKKLNELCVQYGFDMGRLVEENEQLKKDVEYWKQVASQYSNELNVFEHCKKYKTECKDIYWSSD
jgi:FtsZ-binding cell division protein ZapB